MSSPLDGMLAGFQLLALFQSELTLPVQDLAPAKVELTFEWIANISVINANAFIKLITTTLYA